MRDLAFVLASCALASLAFGDSVELPTLVHSPQSSPFNVLGGDLALTTPTVCVVGVRGADGLALNQGAVESFELRSDGWTYLQRLQPSELAAGDQFGEAVAGDAQWMVSSATRHDAAGVDAGAVWIYHREGRFWQGAQQLLPGMGSDGARFGSALALSGNWLAIGSPTASSGGVVTLYQLVGSTWQFDRTIANPSPPQGDRFGDALALTSDRLVVGDPFDDTQSIDRGAVFVYEHAGRSWTLGATLAPSSSSDRQYFGRSLALGASRLAVGANGADASSGTSASGMVEVFDLMGGVWLRSAELRPDTAVVGGHFGWDVAMESSTIVVGEPGFGAGSAVPLVGRSHVFAQTAGGLWTLEWSLQAEFPAAQDVLGTSVAYASGRLVVAAPGRSGQAGALMSIDLNADCDGNSISDLLQVAADPALDCNGDLVLDACQPINCDCPSDLNGDGVVSSADLAVLLAQWGNYGQGSADMNGDFEVDAFDLALLLASWGPCP